MLKAKELSHIILAIILFAFIISFSNIFKEGINVFLPALLIAFIIIGVNIIVKKLMASYLEAEVEQKIWHLQRWGYYQRSYFKKPKPLGVILPFLLIWVSYPYGFLKMLTFLQFDVKAKVSRAAKRHGLYRYTEMTEWHIAAIAGIGIFANLVLSILAYILNAPDLAKYSIYYVVWNLIPISQLDGCKLFFGSIRLWVFLTLLTLVGLFFAIFLI